MELIVVELKAHPVVDLVVLEGDMILVYVVPFLDADLVRPRPSLSGHQFLQIADGVILVALHPHLLPQPIVQHHLDHLLALNPTAFLSPLSNKLPIPERITGSPLIVAVVLFSK